MNAIETQATGGEGIHVAGGGGKGVKGVAFANDTHTHTQGGDDDEDDGLARTIVQSEKGGGAEESGRESERESTRIGVSGGKLLT